MGILANMAKGSQEHARKLQEQPGAARSGQEELLAGAPGWIWASLAIMAKRVLHQSKGSGIGVLTI